MNLDFHYYGTYVAARLAGYDFNSAQTIAHSAQYVDDSDQGMLQDSLGNYYIKDFVPNPTVQSLTDMVQKNFQWSEGSLKSIADIWVPFHFLPANYGANTGIKEYSGPHSDEATLYSWNYDDQYKKQFKLLCLPNSILVKDMINDIITNHEDKDYTLQMVGLRMHVLADTWAHMFHLGIPAWFVNNAGETVYEINGSTRTEVRWRRVWPWDDSTDIIHGESATPEMLAYNSLVYLGHGRIGHLPDYPWLKYQYNPQWSSTEITKDNCVYFLSAIKQLTKALECIRNKTLFDIDSYAQFPAKTENVINEILRTRLNDQSETWKNNINRIEISGEALQVPEDYNKNKWLNEIRGHDIKNTCYYYFNKSASFHLTFVKDTLEENNIYIDETPKEYVVKTKFINKERDYIGKMYRQLEYFPTMAHTGLTLLIIKPTGKLLESGDIVEIKTNEPEVGQYNFLGAWNTPSLYYYIRAYAESKQKWCIEKVDTSGDNKIRAGDQVRFRNMYFEENPYMATYSPWYSRGTYLTTQSDGSSDKAIWIMEGLTEFNMYIITSGYFVSSIIEPDTSNMIYIALKTYNMIDANGNVNEDTMRYVLDNSGLGFIPGPLQPPQSKQVLIQLKKLVNSLQPKIFQKN